MSFQRAFSLAQFYTIGTLVILASVCIFAIYALSKREKEVEREREEERERKREREREREREKRERNKCCNC